MSNPYEAYEHDTSGSATMAQTAMWCGITSVLCILVAPCFCYAPLLMSMPLALVSMYCAFQALADPDPAPGTRPMSAGGLVTATVAFLFTVLISLFMVLYVAMIAMTVTLGV